MRTDAKIGFAIGGVLLAVLAVYLIVVPKHTKKTGVALVTTVDTPVDSTPTIATAPPVMPVVTAVNDSVAPAPMPMPVPLIAPSPATQPVDDHKTIVSRDMHDASNDDMFHPGTPAKPDTNDNAPDPVAIQGGPVLPPMMDIIPPADDHTPATVRHSSAHHQHADHIVTAEKTETIGTGKTYTVKPGQTLSSIAKEVYGNARYWVAIARDNKSIDPKHLKVGTRINLPDVSEVRPGPVLVDVIEPVATVGGSAIDTTGSTYRVQSGDSLYKISKKLFGTGRKATAIYQLNKALIGDDETKLKQGMVLKIPEGTRIAVTSAR